MAKKRIKKLLASALAVSMAVTLLPAAVMAGPNEEMVLEQQAGEFTESGQSVNNLLLGAKKAAKEPGNMSSVSEAEMTGYETNWQHVEDIIVEDPTTGVITAYVNEEDMSDYAPEKGTYLYALIMDCAEGVDKVEGVTSGTNFLDQPPYILASGDTAKQMAAGSNISGITNNYISFWNFTEQNPAKLRLVKGSDAARQYQIVTINCETPTIEIAGTKSVAISGNTTLTASTVPESAKNNVTWGTSDPDKVTVNATTGVVTGVASGNATITATMASGVVSSCEVEVTEPTETPEPEPTETTKPGEIQTPNTTPTPDASVTPDPSVTPDASVTPDPSVTPDASITPDPTGAPDPTGTPGGQVTPTPDPTETPVVDEGTKVETNTGTVVVTDTDKKEVTFDTVDKKAEEVKVPSKVTINGETYIVTKIEDSAFAGSKKLETVTIPATVTEIGKGAFKNCTQLTSVTVPKNVENLGASAFAGCKSLKNVTVKSTKMNAVTANAFKGCTALKTVTLPKTVTTIKKAAFDGCKNLKTLTIKAKTLKVTKGAFKGVSKKAVIKVPKSKVKTFSKLLKKAGFKGKVKAI